MKKRFLTATWKDLIMANYIVDPLVLAPYLPNKTELDVYNGNVLVSIVGFMFADTCIMGIKIPFHVNFEEVNLRFYVRYNDNGTWKRGAVFIKEIVPKPAISFVANTIYHEKYSAVPMKHVSAEKNGILQLSYQWKINNYWNKVEATVEKNSIAIQPGSEEEFIAEHYWGYSKYNSKTTFEYEVSHPRWEIYPLISYNIDCDFTAVYGNKFSFLQTNEPSSVFVAKGSPITVFQKRNL
ncbi:MAG: DUF2071 domain-containing protein [Chitinophagaceae bacterium]|nr:DUF2071 domain-containing protein [Chitinophagaceae bacterium]